MVQQQHATIAELKTTCDILQRDVAELKTPNHDNIFAYIDRQVTNINIETERKLEQKADHKEVETVIPQRLEDLYRNIHNHVTDLKFEMSKKSTKEEFHELATKKVGKINQQGINTCQRLHNPDILS